MFNSCFTYTLGHVKKSGIVDALNLRHLKFDASNIMFFILLLHNIHKEDILSFVQKNFAT